MDTLQELETIEVLDIWNQEFGGIDIDWTGFDANDGDANNYVKEVAKKENVEKEKNVKAKRGRPRLKPLMPEVLSLRRDVSNRDYQQLFCQEEKDTASVICIIVAVNYRCAHCTGGNLRHVWSSLFLLFFLHLNT